jgi:hypothetical protein
MPSIKVDAQGLKGKELEEVVEEDLHRFEEYFVKIAKANNGPLDRYERAILKSYLYFKCVVDVPPPATS